MSRPNWTEIKSDYVTTTMTLAEVQEKWGVNRGTLSSRATREGWSEAKKQFATDLERERREQMLARWAAQREKFDEAVFTVARANLGAIARNVQDPKVDATKLSKLASALEVVQRIGRTAGPSS